MLRSHGSRVWCGQLHLTAEWQALAQSKSFFSTQEKHEAVFILKRNPSLFPGANDRLSGVAHKMSRNGYLRLGRRLDRHRPPVSDRRPIDCQTSVCRQAHRPVLLAVAVHWPRVQQAVLVVRAAHLRSLYHRKGVGPRRWQQVKGFQHSVSALLWCHA